MQIRNIPALKNLDNLVGMVYLDLSDVSEACNISTIPSSQSTKQRTNQPPSEKEPNKSSSGNDLSDLSDVSEACNPSTIQPNQSTNQRTNQPSSTKSSRQQNDRQKNSRPASRQNPTRTLPCPLKHVRCAPFRGPSRHPLTTPTNKQPQNRSNNQPTKQPTYQPGEKFPTAPTRWRTTYHYTEHTAGKSSTRTAIDSRFPLYYLAHVARWAPAL